MTPLLFSVFAGIALGLPNYMLERFGEISGLKVNCQKVLWIGSLRGFDQIFCPEKKLAWANG